MAGRVYDVEWLCPTLGASHFQQTKYILERVDKLEVRCLGNIYKDNWGTGFPGNVWDKEKLSPTLSTMQGGGRQPMIVDEVKNIPCVTDRTVDGGKQFGSVEDLRLKNVGTDVANAVLSRYWKGIEGSNSNAVIVATHDTQPKIIENVIIGGMQEHQSIKSDGICTCLTSSMGTGGGYTPMIVAMRGRNPDNPSDRTVGSPTEQRLEPNSQGICNTLTSVQKDNLVMESVRIKQATTQGYIECEVGGVADLSFPDSNTRRGGVQEKGQVSPTLMAGEQDICRIEKLGQISCDGSQCGTVISENGISANLVAGTHGYANHHICTQYRIRKLTPLECWRLMDFTDADFNKAAQVNSNTQLYKQAGNSIVKNVLIAIIGQMIPGKEEVYKNI